MNFCLSLIKAVLNLNNHDYNETCGLDKKKKKISWTQNTG